MLNMVICGSLALIACFHFRDFFKVFFLIIPQAFGVEFCKKKKKREEQALRKIVN